MNVATQSGNVKSAAVLLTVILACVIGGMGYWTFSDPARREKFLARLSHVQGEEREAPPARQKGNAAPETRSTRPESHEGRPEAESRKGGAAQERTLAGRDIAKAPVEPARAAPAPALPEGHESRVTKPAQDKSEAPSRDLERAAHAAEQGMARLREELARLQVAQAKSQAEQARLRAEVEAQKQRRKADLAAKVDKTSPPAAGATPAPATPQSQGPRVTRQQPARDETWIRDAERAARAAGQEAASLREELARLKAEQARSRAQQEKLRTELEARRKDEQSRVTSILSELQAETATARREADRARKTAAEVLARQDQRVAAEADRRRIAGTLRQLDQSFNAAQFETFVGLLAASFRQAHPEQVANAQRFFALARNVHSERTLENGSIEIQDDHASATCRWALKYQIEGQAIRLRYRSTIRLVREGAAWKIIGWQTRRIE